MAWIKTNEVLSLIYGPPVAANAYLTMKTHYKRNLPHIMPPGATVFITFRLADSIAVAALQQLADQQALAIQEALARLTEPAVRAAAVYAIQKAHFARYDALLDRAAHGPTWLKDPAIASCVMREITLLKELDVSVIACCVMSNHVHLLIQLPAESSFSAARMMQRLKGRTALDVNKLLNRQGQPFWRHESYDHLVRDEKEQARIVAYILNNPVKAGLVNQWTEWPYSYYVG